MKDFPLSIVEPAGSTRTDFDAMDRVVLVDVPGSGADTTIGYTPDGLVSSLRTGIHDQPGDWRWGDGSSRWRVSAGHGWPARESST